MACGRCDIDLVVCLMMMMMMMMHDVAGFPSCRLVLSIMGFFGMVNCYTLRVNLSVAIVAMVNATYLKELETLGHDPNETLEGHSVCEFDEETVGNVTEVVEDFVSFALPLIDDIRNLAKILMFLGCQIFCWEGSPNF